MRDEPSEGAHSLPIYSGGSGAPPLLLIHGFGANAHFWRRWLPHLEARHRTHAVDLLGAGRAEAPREADYAPEAQADRVVTLVRRMGGAAPVLVGHSLGAGIALLATLRLLEASPESAPPALVLVSGAIYPQRLPPFLTLARTPLVRSALLLAPPPRALLRLGIRGIVRRRDRIDAALVDGYREPLRSLARRRALLRGARAIDLAVAARLAERLPELKLPTLLLWGADDRVVPPAAGKRLAREIPGARLVLLPGLGHLPPEEDPEGSVAPVLTFLASLSAPSGGAPTGGS